MLLRSYSENRNKKFQIQGGGANVPLPPLYRLIPRNGSFDKLRKAPKFLKTHNIKIEVSLIKF